MFIWLAGFRLHLDWITIVMLIWYGIIAEAHGYLKYFILYHTWVWKPLEFARVELPSILNGGAVGSKLAQLSTNARAPLMLLWTHLIMTSYSWRYDQMRHVEFSFESG